MLNLPSTVGSLFPMRAALCSDDEFKGRSYREIDILFKHKVPTRQWSKYALSIEDDE